VGNVKEHYTTLEKKEDDYLARDTRAYRFNSQGICILITSNGEKVRRKTADGKYIDYNAIKLVYNNLTSEKFLNSNSISKTIFGIYKTDVTNCYVYNDLDKELEEVSGLAEIPYDFDCVNPSNIIKSDMNDNYYYYVMNDCDYVYGRYFGPGIDRNNPYRESLGGVGPNFSYRFITEKIDLFGDVVPNPDSGFKYSAKVDY
jgi:hypothetical protein